MKKEITFGSVLRAFRTSKNLTLRSVAEALGINLSYLSEIERGIRKPLRPDRIIRIKENFGLPDSDMALLMSLSAEAHGFGKYLPPYTAVKV